MTFVCSSSDRLRGGRMPFPRWGVCLTLALAPQAAIAEDAPDDDAPDSSSDEVAPKRHKSNKHDFKVKGRLLALAELSHRRETVVSVDGGLVTQDRNAL